MGKRKTEKQSPTPEMLKGRLMLTIREYATLVGMPAATAYRYAQTGVLPVTRIGRSLRIPVAAVQAQLTGAGVAA
jgi:excisionase family DNA binding protein